MRKPRLMLCALSLLATLAATSETDNMFMVKRAMSYMAPRCGNVFSSGERASLLEYCWCDTNRLVSALKQIALTNDDYYASLALKRLGELGSTSDLPFLYSCATNPVCGDRALRSIIAIEGISSNSISAVQAYLSNTNAFCESAEDKFADICQFIVARTFELAEYDIYRPRVMEMALAFARDINTMNVGVDETLRTVDPTYRFSRRRLSVMRSARERLVNEVQSNYVANAINELVAYPEADLPD